MASYIIQSETLESMADKVRVLADSSDKMSPDQITTNIAQANDDVEAQASLIEQIRSALDGKAASGGIVKEEQEKTIDITENGTTEVTPDKGKALSKVTVNVEVESGGGGTEEIEKQFEMYYAVSKKLNIYNNATFNRNNWAYNTIPKIDFSLMTGLLYSISFSDIEYIDFYINSEKATTHNNCFSGCTNLVWLMGIDTSNSTNINEMFLNCTKLERIIEPFNFAKVTSANKSFNGCGALREIRFVPETIKLSFGVASPVLSNESIQSIIDGLATFETPPSSWRLTLSNQIVLSDAQKQAIESKGWTLVQ